MLSGQWVVLDSFAEPGRDFGSGKFGFLIQKGERRDRRVRLHVHAGEVDVIRTRRQFVSAALIGLTAKAEKRIPGGFVNDAFPLGHRIRDHARFAAPVRAEKNSRSSSSAEAWPG